jgi:hypothetical protein
LLFASRIICGIAIAYRNTATALELHTPGHYQAATLLKNSEATGMAVSEAITMETQIFYQQHEANILKVRTAAKLSSSESAM